MIKTRKTLLVKFIWSNTTHISDMPQHMRKPLSWRNDTSATQRTAEPSPFPQMKCANTETNTSRPF